MTIYGKGTFIAAAVAGLIGCASSGSSSNKSTSTPMASGGPVNCAGINSCKGQGSCAGNDNACKAMNSCKGKGYVEVSSAEECKQKGGTVFEKKM
jgi:hypothetical protein